MVESNTGRRKRFQDFNLKWGVAIGGSGLALSIGGPWIFVLTRDTPYWGFPQAIWSLAACLILIGSILSSCFLHSSKLSTVGKCGLMLFTVYLLLINIVPYLITQPHRWIAIYLLATGTGILVLLAMKWRSWEFTIFPGTELLAVVMLLWFPSETTWPHCVWDFVKRIVSLGYPENENAIRVSLLAIGTILAIVKPALTACFLLHYDLEELKREV